jgi:hypothetical protein
MRQSQQPPPLSLKFALAANIPFELLVVEKAK